jgi:superoxide dismutase, Fe-Mn family
LEHALPPLPFDRSALEPHMSAETIDYHYAKHHQAYITNLNKLIGGTEFQNCSLEEIITREPVGAIYNNAAQIWNHTFFWSSLSPQGGGSPSGQLLEAICARWGSFDEFKTQFKQSAIGNFGSSWTWLVQGKDQRLSIVNTGAAGNPLTEGLKPLLCIDLWEHAYYIDHRNARPNFLDAFLNHLVNWSFAESRLS